MRNSGLRTGQGRRRARREHRRVGRWAFVAVAAAAMCGVGASVGAAAEPATAPTGGSAAASMPVPFNEQAYTTDTPDNPQTSEPIDPYNGDPSSIHIAVNSGSELARSFVHIALDYLPPGTTATGVTATFHLTAQSDASNTGTYPTYNVQTSSAIVEACALSTPLASPFDPAKPPPYDCEHGSAIGKPNAAGDTWTFNLKDLLAYWHTHGNTGAALLPIVASPSSTWGVAFYVSRSSAVVSYVSTPAAAVVPPVTATSTPAVRASTAAPVPQVTPAAVAQAPPVAGPTAGPPAAPAPAASATMTVAPTVAAPQVATSVAPATSSGRTGGSGGGVRSYWPWVLIGCLVLVAGSLGIAHRGALAAYARRVGPAGLAMYRVHPRAYTVASVAAAWGLVFSGYSLVVHPAAPGSGSTLASGPANGATSNSAGGASGGTQPGTQGVGHAKTHVVRLANGTLAVVPVAGPTSGSTSTPTVTNPQASEFSGAGTYRVINGVEVFFPANGGPPVADLYHGADDTIGISATTINLCAHAALTYGAAFNISASDLHVYWAWRNAHGGLYGRKVNDTYQNDNYDPGTAVQAAQACKDANTFMLLGGIGFDQIPAVRVWAEQNHELYYHHIATIQNTAGLRYSFSPLPTVEQMGTLFGELAVQRFRGKKIGVLYRDSSNWTPGSDAFEQVVKAAGMTIVGSYPVTINQGNYTQELAELHTAGAQVVFGWENALASTEMIKQAEGQDYYPAWLVFPFNLEVNTLGSAALSQPIWGVAAWDAYDPGYYGGGFTPYASLIHEFEAEYKTYDPNANLSGDGGDLLFLNWEAQRQIADLFELCGPQCTRNRMAGILLAGYDRTVPPNCNIDFNRTGDHHHGGYLANVLEVIKDPNGRANFVPIQRCVAQIGGG